MKAVETLLSSPAEAVAPMLCSVCPDPRRFEQRAEDRMIYSSGKESGVCAGAWIPREDPLQVCCRNEAMLRIPASREAGAPCTHTSLSASFVPLCPLWFLLTWLHRQ